MLETAVRIGIVVSVIAAAVVFVWISGPDFGLFASLVGAAALIGWVAGRHGFSDLVLASGYFVPLLFRFLFGKFYEPYLMVWLVAMLAVVLSGPPRLSWSLPPRWRAPLLLWGLIVALSWPIILLRELDFTPSLIDAGVTTNSVMGALPYNVASGIIMAAAAHGVGLLWIDRLFATFDADDFPRFEQQTLVPLGIAAVFAGLLAIYQGVVDITALSGGLWPTVGRAAGSLGDANASAMVMAIWAVALFALASRSSIQWKAAALTGSALTLAAMWASGSRSALMAVAVGAVGIALGIWRQTRNRRPSPILTLGTALAVLVAGVIAALWFAPQISSQSPMARILDTLPEGPLSASIGRLAGDLWTRNGYGTAAVRMVQDSPLVGVGIGAFHTLSSDYARLSGYFIPSDNAQNWYRQQIAELGVVGSLGWIGWMAMFIPVMVSSPRQREYAFAFTVVGAVIAAVAVVSLVGMPTQNAVVALTFWTLLYWCARLAHPAALRKRLTSTISRILLAAVFGIAIGYALLTIGVAKDELRVPYRAQRVGWPYSYGFSRAIAGPDGREFRRTGRHAIDVFPVEGNWLKVTVWVEHPTAQNDPVDVRMWREPHELIFRAAAHGSTPITWYVEAPVARQYMLIETWVGRTWQAPGVPEAGLSVAKWEWLDAPPRGAQILRVRRL